MKRIVEPRGVIRPEGSICVSLRVQLLGMPPVSKPLPRTIAGWMSASEAQRLEFVDGEFVEKAAPSAEHGFVQAKVVTQVSSRFNRRTGGRQPGGWWIVSEVDIQLANDGFRPDLCGWRRERLSALPRERPIALCPDWICEIVSSSNASNDRVVKMRAYHRAGVPHYWLIDPVDRSLLVMRHAEGGYLNVLAATAEEIVRAEPFESVEFRVRDFFDDEEDDG